VPSEKRTRQSSINGTGKPASTNGGRWLPGQSGNPSGRAKRNVDIGELLRPHIPHTVEVLLAALEDPADRIPAARIILDRVYGKPLQQIEQTTTSQLTVLHLLAARAISEKLQSEPLQLGTASFASDDEIVAPETIDLNTPAKE